MQGPHIHNWKYNEVKEIYHIGAIPYFEVVRFCTECLELEILKLKEIPLSGALTEVDELPKPNTYTQEDVENLKDIVLKGKELDQEPQLPEPMVWPQTTDGKDLGHRVFFKEDSDKFNQLLAYLKHKEK